MSRCGVGKRVAFRGGCIIKKKKKYQIAAFSHSGLLCAFFTKVDPLSRSSSISIVF
mgnify:CR=1 FL=1